MEWVKGTVRGKVYVPKVEEEVVTKKEYDSDDEDDVKTEVTHNSSMLDEETNQALMTATAGDIQDIADILGVTFQEHCMATPLKVRSLNFQPVITVMCGAGLPCRGSEQHQH